MSEASNVVAESTEVVEGTIDEGTNLPEVWTLDSDDVLDSVFLDRLSDDDAERFVVEAFAKIAEVDRNVMWTAAHATRQEIKRGILAPEGTTAPKDGPMLSPAKFAAKIGKSEAMVIKYRRVATLISLGLKRTDSDYSRLTQGVNVKKFADAIKAEGATIESVREAADVTLTATGQELKAPAAPAQVTAGEQGEQGNGEAPSGESKGPDAVTGPEKDAATPIVPTPAEIDTPAKFVQSIQMLGPRLTLLLRDATDEQREEMAVAVEEYLLAQLHPVDDEPAPAPAKRGRAKR